jgi:hypothetical protein
MDRESPATRKQTVLWNAVLLVLSLVVLALIADRRVFLANVLLAIILAFNAVRYLAVLRERTIGYVLALLACVDIFLVVLWFLKSSAAR